MTRAYNWKPVVAQAIKVREEIRIVARFLDSSDKALAVKMREYSHNIKVAALRNNRLRLLQQLDDYIKLVNAEAPKYVTSINGVIMFRKVVRDIPVRYTKPKETSNV